MRTLTARRLVTDNGTLDFPVLTLDADGILLDITSDPAALARNPEVQDTLTAAFLDIHTHGAMGHDVMHVSLAGLSKMQRFLAQHGTASYLPTTVTASIDSTLRALENLADAIDSPAVPSEAKPIGIHLEGPFLSHIKRGVHPEHALQPPSIELFDRFQSAARGHIILMTLAPELIGPSSLKGTGFSPSGKSIAGQGALAPEGSSALDLIHHATSKGIKISLGHSNATAAETRAGIDAGATSSTHLFNAMRALDHREPGIVGALLDAPNTFAELICDGIHVAPELIRLWLKLKGPGHAILVTDGMSATGMPDGNYTLGDFAVTVADGRALLTEALAAGKETLAGSLLTLDLAVANLQAFTRADLATATRLASHNPAAMLGHPTLTQIAVGSPLSLNRFNPANHLTQTILRGQSVDI